MIFWLFSGTVDECNAAIGLATSHLTTETDAKSSSSNGDGVGLVSQDLQTLVDRLQTLQRYLFDIGAHLATPQTSSSKWKVKRTQFPLDAVSKMEQWIDEMEDKLQPLTTFILPGGHPAAAALQLARTIARRAERCVTPLFLAQENSPEEQGTEQQAGTNGSAEVSKSESEGETRSPAEKDIDPSVFQFLNRLSDFLFVASRCANHLMGVSDVLWRS